MSSDNSASARWAPSTYSWCMCVGLEHAGQHASHLQLQDHDMHTGAE